MDPIITAELVDLGTVTVTNKEWYYGILIEGTKVGRGSFDFGTVVTAETLVGVVVKIGNIGLYVVTGESKVVAIGGLYS